MTKPTKKSKKADVPAVPTVPPADPKQITVKPQLGETFGQTMARVGLSAAAQAVGTLQHYQNTISSENFIAQGALDNLDRKYAEIQAGDLSNAEQMLYAQAETLQTMFQSLACRAIHNINGGALQVGETYMRMALKAQSQCRTTLEALAEIKFPKSATFIKQANIAQQQQVNNGQPPAGANPHARTHEKDITPTNELLESKHGERLDTGTASTAGGTHSDLVPVGPVNRAKN